MKKRRKLVKFTPIYRIVRASLGRWLTKRFELSMENPEVLEQLEPPFLMLANHTSFWDPFLVSLCLNKQHIFYVTSDAAFRSPLYNFLLKLAAAIPKTKAQNDLNTIKYIMDLKKQKEVVGIFPEGRRTWDGKSLNLVPSTAKLVRMLKIPVVTVLLKGAYTLNPRWSPSSQPGKITLHAETHFTDVRWKELSTEEIHRHLSEALDYDEGEFLKTHPSHLTDPKRGEGLERVLYLCPQCRTIGSLHSEGSRLHCHHCSLQVEYGEDGLLSSIKSDFPIPRTIREWNNIQREELRNRVNNVQPNEILMSDDVFMETGYKSRKSGKRQYGRLDFSLEAIIFTPTGGEPQRYLLENITGLNVQNNEYLDFYYQKTLHSFNRKDRRFAGYKWLSIWEVLREIPGNNCEQ